MSAIFSDTSITTTDASAATGAMILNLAVSAVNTQTIKTGSAADTITTTYTGLSGDDTIDLGAGVDALLFNADATFSDTTTAARLSKVTNVEKLGTIAHKLSIDGNLVDQTIFTTSGTNGALEITNAANNTTLEFGAGAANASTAAMEQDATTLNIELNGSNATMNSATDVSNGLTVTGSGTINLKTNGTSGVAANQLALTATDNQNVVITGSQALRLTTTTATGTNGFSIDGSAATGTLNITGTSAIDTIKGGAADDILDGGGGDAIAEIQTFTITGPATTNGYFEIGGVTGKAPAYSSADDIGNSIVRVQDSIKLAQNSVNSVAYDVNTDTVTVTFLKTAGDVDNIVVNLLAAGASFGPVIEEEKGVAIDTVVFSADVFTGGAGNDTFVIGTDGAATAVVADTITDFTTGTDKIDFKVFDVAGSAETYKAATATVADFTAAKAAADVVFSADTTVVYSAQQVGADTYVFAATADADVAAHVVKLTGVSLDGIEFGDIIA